MARGTFSRGLWVISPRLDALEYREKLMGSVVKYPDFPIESHVPYHSPVRPKELVPDLDPRPIQVRNMHFWDKNVVDAKMKATIQSIVATFVDATKENSTEAMATIARVWHMSSPGEKFKALLRDEYYFDEVFKLLQSNHGVGYFITAIVTFVNLEERQIYGSSTGAGGSLEGPFDSRTGFNSRCEAVFGIAHERFHSECYQGETIVFMGYRKIELVKVKGIRAKLRRLFQGEKHGLAIMDRDDHWPEMKELPHQGTVNNFLGGPDSASARNSMEEERDPEAKKRYELFDKMGKRLQLDPWF
ncbi:hypothetical protein UVI_02014840 [Ustilaginoidea virens]|uniref:Uncharacterized protein n=1 Tax=Ustilaginoidea virens TaxID=1159556 RepID=A0A1B5L607_USTVR|nr:hypothetical protein UVI_02014840 [Ustilaginoidea virens]